MSATFWNMRRRKAGKKKEQPKEQAAPEKPADKKAKAPGDKEPPKEG